MNERVRLLCALVCVGAMAWACTSGGGSSSNGEDSGGGTGPTTDDAYPLFGLTRAEICTAWCAKYEACDPDRWAEAGESQERCVPDCQETQDEAWGTESRPDCGRAINSLYACQAQTCEDFVAGMAAGDQVGTCAPISETFLEKCIL